MGGNEVIGNMREDKSKTLLGLIEKCGRFLYHRRGGRRSQMRILGILGREGEMTQTQLQRKLEIQSGSMSEVMLKLEGKGLIERNRDEADKRKIKVKISEQGEAYFRNKHQGSLELDNHLFDVLTEEEQKQLKGILTKLHSYWENDMKKYYIEHEKEREDEC